MTTNAFGSPQKEHAARLEGIVKQRDQLLLQITVQIDQHVAATDEVEFGKRRVFDHVLLGKNQQIADAPNDAKGAAVRFLSEKARQPLRGDIGGDVGGIDTGAGRFDGSTVNIGGEYLYLVTLRQLLQLLLEQDGKGIGLLSGGTADGPEANGGAGWLAGK